MANTFTPAANPSGTVLPVIRMVGMIPFSLASTETYATATSGFPITVAHLEAFLDDFGLGLQVKASDIIGIIGATTLGHMAKAYRQTDGSWKVELWNGTTEIADGALTHTIDGFLLFSAGSPS